VQRRALIAVVILCAAAAAPKSGQAPAIKNLDDLFAPDLAVGFWRQTHCDLYPAGKGVLRLGLHEGYETTGIESSRLPFQDWSSWRSFRFDVENQSSEPLSVYVRISNRADHLRADTYTGGTFDGFVIGPGHNTVEISLENMQSPEARAIDRKQIAWLGIFVQPLFLRDGMDLKFAKYTNLDLSNPRLSPEPARLQKQPYADLLFAETEPSLRSQREQVEQALARLQNTIAEAKSRGIETAYAEIYPFLAELALHKRLVAFWQDRSQEQRRALNFLLEASQSADSTLKAALDGKLSSPSVPPILDYGKLTIRDRYFRLDDQPVLPFGMLYNHDGPLLRWFANSETDYGTELVAGGTRHDVERQPIWQAYHKYPDTHRVGWPHADHIIRDAQSWEVLGPPVSVCLESPHSREAVAAMIEKFEQQKAGRRDHLVQNMGFEYTYVCYCNYTKRMWADWLRRKYSDIDSANQIWGTRYKDFNTVDMFRPIDAEANRAVWFDWSSFNLYRFLEQIRWTHDQIRRWKPDEPLTVGSPYYAFSPAFWTGVDEEELADSGITSVVLEENYALDTLMPEYLHALAGTKPVADFEYHGVIHQILPSFLHGDAVISMWWWNDEKHWTLNEPINEWTTSFPQSYTIPLSDVAKAMRDALDLRRLGREVAALASAPRPVVLLYSKTSMLQQLPSDSRETDTTQYLSELRRTYNASQSAGLYVGFTTENKILAGDLRQRKILVLPSVEYLPAPVTSEILRWVDSGGTLVVSPNSFIGDEYARPSQRPPVPGLEVTRREPPPLNGGEKFVTEYNVVDLPRMPLLNRSGEPFKIEGVALEAAGMRQTVNCDPASIMAHFRDGTSALVDLRSGRGHIYWLTTPLLPESWSRFLSFVAENSGLKPDMLVAHEEGSTASQIEYRVTGFEGNHLAYLYNDSDQDMQLVLRPRFSFKEILDRRTETPLSGTRLLLPRRETAILQFR
jgi:Beta-galactosidase/Beta-galactosidase trimerisation domain